LKKSPRFAKIENAVTWDFSNLGPKVPGDRIFDFFEPGTAGSQVTAYHQFSDSYGVPTLAFSLTTLEGARISPEKCWEEIFEQHGRSFVGNISVEDCKYETKPLRLYKLHPCATPKVMEGLSNAKNITKSIANILTEQFQKYDKNIRFL
jgi:hypothetical protein